MFQASVKGIPMTLMTSHLESTKAHAKERMNQMKKCLNTMTEATDDQSVVFGGDMNIRDQEVNYL